MEKRKKKTASLSITQVARACGVSRTTLRRLDEEGLLKPANAPKAGEKREYQLQDIIRLCRILKLQECGLTHRTISGLLNFGDEYNQTIRRLEMRVRFLQDIINDMKAVSDRANHLSVTEYDLSESYVYEKSFTHVPGYSYTAQAAAETLEEAVRAGCRLDIDKGLALKYTDFVKVLNGEYHDNSFAVSIPVFPKDDEDRIAFYPEQHVISVMWFGTYENILEGMKVAKDEAKKRHLKPAGPLYFRLVFDAAFDYNISEDQNLVNIVLPVIPA